MGANELPSGTYFFNIEVSGAGNLKKITGLRGHKAIGRSNSNSKAVGFWLYAINCSPST